jgi:O-antigen biosynthesis alpha-1,3-rhamnosyltransferase
VPATALRIGVEGGVLARPLPTGVDRYVRNLMAELVRQQPGWQLDIGVLRGGGRPAADLIAAPNVRTPRAKLADRAYRALVRRGVPVPFDLAAGVGAADVFVFPDFVVWPLLHRTPVVAFVYDLSFLHHADQADARHAEYLTAQVEATVRRAATVVTISRTVRDEIVARYGIPADRVVSIYPAVDRTLFRPRDPDETAVTRARLGLPSRYLLLTGTLEPRKNLVAAIDAYDALPAAVRDEVALVLVGKTGWHSEPIVRAIHRPRDAGAVVQVGFASDEDLAAVYSAAEMLLFPSLYEGFGLPMVEAMASGIPVLAADRPVLAEVGGPGVTLVDAEDTATFAAAVELLLTDRTERARSVAAGRERVSDFDWAISGAELAGVLRDAAG